MSTASGGSAANSGAAVSAAVDVEATEQTAVGTECQATRSSSAQAPGEQSETAKPAAQNIPPPQPKRILGVMPNFRAVSAGTHPPPPTPKQAFMIATQNSFDYSSFIFVGITSAFAEWTNAHRQLGQGMAGLRKILLARVCGQSRWQLLGDLHPTDHLPSGRALLHAGQGENLEARNLPASRILITPELSGTQ